MHRRDLVCGGGAAVFSAILLRRGVASLLCVRADRDGCVSVSVLSVIDDSASALASNIGKLQRGRDPRCQELIFDNYPDKEKAAKMAATRIATWAVFLAQARICCRGAQGLCSDPGLRRSIVRSDFVPALPPDQTCSPAVLEHRLHYLVSHWFARAAKYNSGRKNSGKRTDLLHFGLLTPSSAVNVLDALRFNSTVLQNQPCPKEPNFPLLVSSASGSRTRS
jgi:hypothetical protein